MTFNRALNVLGIRGIPAAHGGFETFAERFCLHLRDAGWNVVVYCQGREGAFSVRNVHLDEWNGIQRVRIDTLTTGALATIEFDLRCTINVLMRPGVDLILGYNTAIFCVIQRLFGRTTVMNMDGIEWKRMKWGRWAKLWFWMNEWIGGRLATVRIADHPCIAKHLERRGCGESTMIPYGSDVIAIASNELLGRYDLTSEMYLLTIARIEPENSILEIVQAFVQSGCGFKLVVLGGMNVEGNPYHAKVKAAANSDVIFPGAIYDKSVVGALRFHCAAYLHGHQVGGTNPSLVEALGAGSPVIAHDNEFNKWTAGAEQLFFRTRDECAEHIRNVCFNEPLRARMKAAGRKQHIDKFTFDCVHKAYEDVLSSCLRGRR